MLILKWHWPLMPVSMLTLVLMKQTVCSDTKMGNVTCGRELMEEGQVERHDCAAIAVQIDVSESARVLKEEKFPESRRGKSPIGNKPGNAWGCGGTFPSASPGCPGRPCSAPVCLPPGPWLDRGLKNWLPFPMNEKQRCTAAQNS